MDRWKGQVLLLRRRPRNRYLVAAVLVIAVAIQFVRPARTNPPATTELNAPAAVKEVLERSCYDCHSNHTTWPWYSGIAPMSWLVAWDVTRGRDKLNFTDWPVFDFELEDLLYERIHDQLRENRMPLRKYLWLHRNAVLSPADRRLLLDWAAGMRTTEPTDTP